VVEADEVPLAIDELPLVALLGCFAEGETVVRGAGELRVKESDRLQAMAEGLAVLGVENRLLDDGIDIVGCRGKVSGKAEGPSYGGGQLDSLGDHRIAMAFTIAGLRAAEEIVIDDCANVATSFPGFIGLARQVGLYLEEQYLEEQYLEERDLEEEAGNGEGA